MTGTITIRPLAAIDREEGLVTATTADEVVAGNITRGGTILASAIADRVTVQQSQESESATIAGTGLLLETRL